MGENFFLFLVGGFGLLLYVVYQLYEKGIVDDHREKIPRLDTPAWWLEGPIDWPKFVQFLISEPFPNAILCMESAAPGIEEFVEAESYNAPKKVPNDTIFPATKIVQMRASAEALRRLKDRTDAAKVTKAPFLHAKIHNEEMMILQWHDADCDCGFLVAGWVGEDLVNKMAETLGVAVEFVD